jgi:uncharacterized protein involved in tellurium resistance
MTDEQVVALAQAARAGAMIDSEIEAVIDRHQKKEREFILRYVERTVCGFDTTGHVITGQQKREEPITIEKQP